MSKKEAVILGLIAIGGLGVASSMASDSGGGATAPQRFGRILGADGKKAVASDAGPGSTTYNIAGEAPPSFPAVPAFDMRQLFLPMQEKPIPQPSYKPRAGFTGYSSYIGLPATKKEAQQSYLKSAYSVKPDETSFQRQQRLLQTAYNTPSSDASTSKKIATSITPATPTTRTLSQRISAAGRKGITLKGSRA